MRFEYTERCLTELQKFTGLVLVVKKGRHIDAKAELEIPTLEDGENAQVRHIASEGDWIIRGIQGEFYPCKPEIFEATYEEVER